MIDAIERKQRYRQHASSLLNERSSFDTHWRELGDYILPARSRFFTQDRNKGHKRNQNIIDSTATFAASTLQAGMHAGLTSPARPWFKLATPDQALNERADVKEWLHVTRTRMDAVFAASNLYQALPIVYGDMGTFSIAAMAVLADAEDLFRCYTYPIGSFSLAVDGRGKVCTFAREVEMTVRQLVTQFGGPEGMPLRRHGEKITWTNISKRVKELWDRGNYEATVDVAWMVTPNEWSDRRKLLSKFLPFASCHYELGTNPNVENNAEGAKTGFLREAGFETFPIMCPRWAVTSHEDPYGTDGPGMRALGDVKQLQLMEKRKAQALDKIVDPPLQAPASLRNRPISLLPGHVTHVDARNADQGVRPIHEVNFNIGQFSDDQDRVRYRIQRAFHEDLFLMLATRDTAAESGQPLTAREIVERHEEKLLALGPVLERANDELLEPLVDRVFAMMEGIPGMIPPPPEALLGVDLRVEFISILAQAQKSVGVGAQDRFMQTVGAFVEIFPAMRHKVDSNRFVDNTGEMLGVDPRLIRSDDEANQLAGQEAQAAQAQAAAEQAKNLGQAAAAAGQAPIAPDSALDRVMQGAGAGQ